MAKKLLPPLAYRNFLGGLNTRMDPIALDPGSAQTALDTDLFTGVIAGTPDVGSSVVVNDTKVAAKWIKLVGGGTWVWADDRRYSMDDGALTYATRTGMFPAVFDAQGASTPLGIHGPQGAGWLLETTGTITQTVAFGLSYQTFDGLESNIQNFPLTFAFPLSTTYDKITFNAIWPTGDPRVSAVRLWAAVVYGAVTTTDDTVNTTVTAALTSTGSQTVTPGAITNIVVGSQLTIDTGANQEVVTVTAVPGATFTAVFTRTHAAGFTVTSAIAVTGSRVVTPQVMTNIQVGSVLTIDTGPNEETVTVTAVTATAFTASFTKTHAVGFAIASSQTIGTYYLQSTVTDRNTTTVSLAANPVTSGTFLSWTFGGVANNALYTSDHAPAPVLTCIADRIHSIASGTAASGSGIVFGAVGNVLRWSKNGQPHYWPTVNSMALDHPIEAIIAYTGFTAIFTTGGTYAISGNNDDALSLQRLDTAFNVATNAGRSVIRTPYGTFFLAPEGIAVFDGAMSRLLTASKRARSDFSSLTFNAAGYANLKYYLFHSSGYIVCDIRDGFENARFNNSATTILACTYDDFVSPVVGIAQRAYPTTASATAIGARHFGFCSNNASKLYLMGGTIIDQSVAPGGETAQSTAYALDVSPIVTSSRGIWLSIGPTNGSEARCLWGAVYVNGSVYCQGGTDGVAAGSLTYATMQVYNGTTWDTPVAGGLQRHSYAAASDTSGADTTGFWLQGGAKTAASGGGLGADNGFQKFTISPAGWANVTVNTGTTPTLCGHGMAYVPGGVFSDGEPRLFVFGGAAGTISTANGATQNGLAPDYTVAANIVYCFNLTDGEWTTDATSDNGGTSATAAGCAARIQMVWAYDSASQRIFLHGGRGSGGAILGDLWEFNPRTWVDATGAKVAAWVNKSGSVINVDDRSFHGAAFATPAATDADHNPSNDAATLYLACGSSMLNAFNSDVYAVKVNALELGGTTQGLYVLKSSDGGNIRLLEGGSAQGWTWRTGDYEGENPSAIKHAQTLRIDYQGQIVVGCYADEGSLTTLATLQSATRTQALVQLPFRGTVSASKTEPGNTATQITAISSDASGGPFNLVVVNTSYANFDFTWAGGTTQSFTGVTWANLFPLSLVGGTTAGTLTITNTGAPPSAGTNTDAVTISSSGGAARGKRLSFSFVGSTYSAKEAKLWSAIFEVTEDAAV